MKVMMIQYLSGNDWNVSHFLPGEASAANNRIQRISEGEWYGGSFIPAVVPGDVQSDAIDAGLIDGIDYGYDARKAEWTYQRDWLYVKRFVPSKNDAHRVKLCFDGVDYACQVFLNGKWLGNHDNAWIPFAFDVTEYILPDRENTLLVLVEAAPEAECQWGHTSKVRNMKARFAYGWDWCMRLVPLGIWKDVYVRYEETAVVDDLYVTAEVDYQRNIAQIRAEAQIGGDSEELRSEFILKHPDGHVEKILVPVKSGKATALFEVDQALLWYPNGMGAQPLYQMSVILGDNMDSRNTITGLRHIEWKRTEGAGDDALSYQPYINGRRVYLQGYNYTPIRQLYGRPHEAEYQKRIKLVKKSGANYLRVWGGGLLEREEFYNLCDREGILVMQELFQSSAAGNNHPPRDPEYIKMITETTASAVVQKRNHPSLIAWCGGNELCFRGEYMDERGNILVEDVEGMEGLTYDVRGYHWVPLSPEYPTLAAMRQIVSDLDPDRMWFHTSGSGPVTQGASLKFTGGDMHDVHGPWTIMAPSKFYEFYNALDMMIHHEFGVQASASVQTLEKITPEKYLWPLDEDNPMVNYRNRVFAKALKLLVPYFGELRDHRSYALTSRFIQWEHARYAMEAHRRLGNRCAGACWWHLGEPWPNIIECCVIDAYDQVKPTYYGQKAAFRPLHISAHYDSVIHADSFAVEIALHNSTTKLVSGNIRMQIFALDGTMLDEKTVAAHANPDSVEAVAASAVFKNLPDGVFFLRQMLLDLEGNVLDKGYSIHSTNEVPYAELLSQPECRIETNLKDGKLYLTNTGNAVVSGLTVECDNRNTVFFSDGCLMLLPGEEVCMELEYVPDQTIQLMMSGFGVPYQNITI